MAKKNRPSIDQSKPTRKSFDLESWPYLTPAAFGVMLIGMLILFGEFIFSDRMLFGSDTITAGVFFRHFYVDYVHQFGSIPQWNPYIFCGMPFVDAFHGDIFYPLSVLKFFGNFYRMLGMNLVIHIFLSGIFMYLTARQFKLSKMPSLLSAACYMFAPLLVSWVAPGHDGKIFVTTLFPLVILFLDRGLRSERFLQALFNFSLMGLVIGFIILSPHAQMSYFMLWAAALYTLFRLVITYTETKNIFKLVRPGTLALYAVVIGLLISAIQFYPGYIYTTEYSPRSGEKSGWEWATTWSMHEEEAFSQLIPEFVGTSSHSVETYYWGKNAFKDNSESVGVITIFLALLGLSYYRRKEAYFFGALGLFALIYAVGDTTPMFKLFYTVIPNVKSLRAPAMIMFLFSFSAALLAGMGAQAISERRNSKEHKAWPRFNYLLFGLPVFMLALALAFSANGKGMIDVWCSLFYSEAPMIEVQKNVSKLSLAYMNLPAIQSGAWWAFLMTSAAALFVWFYRAEKAGAWVLSLLVLLPAADGVRFGSRFVDTVDPAQIWSPNPVTEFFAAREGQYRVLNLTSRAIPDDFLPFFGTEVVVGYHGNQLRWYDELLGGMRKSNLGNPSFLNLVGAKYILWMGQDSLPENYFGDKPITVAAQFGQLKIIENDNAFPRVYLADQYRVFDSTSQIIESVMTRADDLRRVVYLEQEPSISIALDSTASDSAWIVGYGIDSVSVGVNTSANKILVMTDNYYHSWHPYVDGQPAELLRSYGSFRAVAVPAGAKQVLFKYSSERYRTGKLATGATTLWVLLVVAFYFYRSRSKSAEERTS
ncbi:MAG: hypothetical protein AB1483_11785 [Candidatus Zixiibacteriota bacterium]